MLFYKIVTEWNVTARYHGVSKRTVVYQLKEGLELLSLGNIGIDATTVLLENSKFIILCHDFQAKSLTSCKIKALQIKAA